MQPPVLLLSNPVDAEAQSILYCLAAGLFLQPASFRTLFDHAVDLLDAIASGTSAVDVRSSMLKLLLILLARQPRLHFRNIDSQADKQYARGEYGAHEIQRPARFADAATKCTRRHIPGAG